MNEARIISIISSKYVIEDDYKKRYDAILAGKMRLSYKPLVNDRVYFAKIDNQFVIQKIIARKNYLIRPSLANIDQALIVMSLKEPDFSFELVNRLIMLIEYASIKPLILITKIDLGDKNKAYQIVDYYKLLGYECYLLEDLCIMEEVLKDKVSVLCGQSGVGKTSLLNKLIPTLELKTDSISKVLNRGKHTTRHTELYEVFGGYVADTPGFSSLDISHIDKELLALKLTPFKPYINGCRFLDCRHLKEPDCAVKNAVLEAKIPESFYNVYVDIMKMLSDGNFKANRHRTLK